MHLTFPLMLLIVIGFPEKTITIFLIQKLKADFSFFWEVEVESKSEIRIKFQQSRLAVPYVVDPFWIS